MCNEYNTGLNLTPRGCMCTVYPNSIFFITSEIKQFELKSSPVQARTAASTFCLRVFEADVIEKPAPPLAHSSLHTSPVAVS